MKSKLNLNEVYDQLREWRRINAPRGNSIDDELDIALYKVQALINKRLEKTEELQAS